MAKITLGPIITAARGRVGSVVYSRNRGQDIARTLIKPPNPNSPNMQAARGSWSIACKIWAANLTDLQRAAWDALAQTTSRGNPISGAKPYGGYPLCTLVNYYSQYLGSGNPFYDPPPNLLVTEPTYLNIDTLTASPASLVVNVNAPTLRANEWFVIYATCPITQGRRNFYKWLCAVTETQTPGPTDWAARWATVMTQKAGGPFTLTTGTRIGVLLQIINYDNAWLSRPLIASAITL